MKSEWKIDSSIFMAEFIAEPTEHSHREECTSRKQMDGNAHWGLRHWKTRLSNMPWSPSSTNAQGEMVVIRFADDTIVGFQYQTDADHFLENLRERLGKFGLELQPDKTRRIEFGRYAEQNRKRRGEGKPETFDFLGFTHISGKNGLGRFMVRRTTIRKRMRAKLRQVGQQLRARMHDPVPQTGRWLKSVVQGYFNYYAVPGNLKSLGVFRDRVLALWWRTLRRRSQKRRINWTRILALAQRWLPQPRTLHPFPDARFAASHLR
jgi:RNA-directed DNA polymerase